MSLKFNPIEGILELAKGGQQGGGDPTRPAASAEKLLTSFIAGELISAMKLIYIANDARAFVAEYNESFIEAEAIGISTTTAASAGLSVEVQLFGLVSDASLNFGANELLFLGPAGTIVSTAPTTGHATRVGYGLGPGLIFLNIEKPIVL